MILNDLYNILSVGRQELLFNREFSNIQIICANTGMFYHQGKNEDEIILGGYYDEPMNKEWVLSLPVVNIDARENKVRVWVDG